MQQDYRVYRASSNYSSTITLSPLHYHTRPLFEHNDRNLSPLEFVYYLVFMFIAVSELADHSLQITCGSHKPLQYRLSTLRALVKGSSLFFCRSKRFYCISSSSSTKSVRLFSEPLQLVGLSPPSNCYLFLLAHWLSRFFRRKPLEIFCRLRSLRKP